MKYTSYLIPAIQGFEGYSEKAYDDPVRPGLWTIGFGRTAGVKQGMTTTRQKEEKDLLDTVNGLCTSLDKVVYVALAPEQGDGLLSLVYNVGLGAFLRSHFRAKINAKDPKAPLELLDWDHDEHGNVVAGLKRRRDWEYHQWLSAPWPPVKLRP